MIAIDRYGKISASLVSFSFLCAIGGFLCGLVGAGGGLFFVYAIGKIMGKGKTQDTFATSSLALLSASIVSSVIYYFGGKISADVSPHYILAGILGGFLGAYLLPRVPARILRIIFALIVIYSGSRMVFSA